MILPGWENASAIVLSCPGPLRRHAASLMPAADVALPQVLLGCESQLLAFAAAATSEFAGRLFFAPLPEVFPGALSLRAALRRQPAPAPDEPGPGAARGRLVHLRFGSVRAARVLKGVRNACVVAEAGDAVPLTASHHPFASGMVLPAAVNRIFTYDWKTRRPTAIGGAAISVRRLPAACVDADLLAGPPETAGGEAETGFEVVALGEFRSTAWAIGPVRSRAARALLAAGGQPPAVLLPWNMDHPGSIVPDLLERLAKSYGASQTGADHAGAGQAGASHGNGRALPRIVLLPFNYVGQTGIIRSLIARLREAAHEPDALIAAIFLARVSSLHGIPALRRVAAGAWVDGNDPEHWWTLARLSACGIAPILIDAGHGAPAGVARVQADEAIWVDGETRYGALTFAARLPSLRMLPRLLALTASPAVTIPRRPGGSPASAETAVSV